MTADPLLRDAPTPLATELPVLGVPARLETNDRAVLALFGDSFGHWRDAVPDAPRGVRVRVIVRDGTEHTAGRAPVRHLLDGARLVVHSPGSVAIADPERGDGVAHVTSELVADREHFQVAVLEALTYALIAHADRHPLHAAAVAHRGRAALLAGPSGAGKSTLAYAAHTAGLDVLSDDHVWVQSEPALRVWGASRRARLLPDAPAHFPEVAQRGTLSTAGGKRKLVMPLGATCGVADDAVVCLLARGESASLERVTADVVVDALAGRVDAGFDRFPERHRSVVRRLAADGGWRLTLSGDPRDALPLVREVLGASIGASE